MSTWTLVNGISASLTLGVALLVGFLIREVYSARPWIPNRLAITVDLAGIALFGFLAAASVLIGLGSIVFAVAPVAGMVNLAAVLGVLAVAAGVWRNEELPSPPGDVPPSVTPPERDRPSVVVLAGGDVSFDRRYRPPVLVRGGRGPGNLPITLSWLLGRPALPTPRLNVERGDGSGPIPGPLVGPFLQVEAPDGGDPTAVLDGVGDLLAEADIGLVNLESPLSESQRFEPLRLTSKPAWASALADAGVDVVNVANNHAFDAGEKGALETYAALEEAGVQYVGGGRSLAEARGPCVLERSGVRVAILGYTQKMGRVAFDYAVATDELAGCLPLDPWMVLEDLERARRVSDVVIVTPHWGVEERPRVSPSVRRLGRWLIDAGADAVLGHGPHVIQGVELYKGRPIVYSLGTLVFGYCTEAWDASILARLVFQGGVGTSLEIIPVAGGKDHLLSPHPLTGEPARQVLARVQGLSRPLGTKLAIEGDRIVVELSSPR